LEGSALIAILVTLLTSALGWLVLVLIVRRGIDSSGTSRKLDLLTDEIRMLRRELRERDIRGRDNEVKGHQVDHSV